MEVFKWNLEERSRLFHLKPINKGTPLAEGLTSYIMRLAQAHCMTTGELIAKELTPLLNKPYLNRIAVQGGTRFYENAAMLNGVGKAAKDFVVVLEGLTRHQNLAGLTLLSIASSVPDRNLCRSKRTWCPRCLAEWQRAKQPIYEPLAWMLRPVASCAEHNILLEQLCPHCRRTMSILERRAKPGCCSKCGGWLGGASIEKMDKPDSLSFELAKEIGSLIAWQSMLPLNTEVKINNLFFSRCIDVLAEGNSAEFARKIEKPKTTVWDWVKGKNLPTLGRLAELCCQVEVSLVEVLSGGLPPLKAMRRLYTGTGKQNKLSKNKASESMVECKLEEIVRAEFPLSLRAAARQVKVNSKVLKSHFPAQCEKIRKQYQAGRIAAREKRFELKRNQLLTAIAALKEKGIYPSRRAIEETMPYKGALREAKLKMVWHTAIKSNNEVSNKGVPEI